MGKRCAWRLLAQRCYWNPDNRHRWLVKVDNNPRRGVLRACQEFQDSKRSELPRLLAIGQASLSLLTVPNLSDLSLLHFGCSGTREGFPVLVNLLTVLSSVLPALPGHQVTVQVNHSTSDYLPPYRYVLELVL